jgi:phage baseplate assembly protein W
MNTLDHPYHFDGSGRTAGTGRADHIRDLIEQVLFTTPGERVMRPDFGAGLLAMVFEPNSAVMAGTAQFLLKSGLQRHLSHLIAVDAVSVENIDSTLQVTVRYVVLAEGDLQQASFTAPGGAT